MVRSFFRNPKLVLLVVLLLSLLVTMVLIWRHYDMELQRIDQQINESKARTKAIGNPNNL